MDRLKPKASEQRSHEASTRSDDSLSCVIPPAKARPKLAFALDLAGLSGLFAAAGFIMAFYWFADDRLDAVLLDGFFRAFVVGLLCLGAARILELIVFASLAPAEFHAEKARPQRELIVAAGAHASTEAPVPEAESSFLRK